MHHIAYVVDDIEAEIERLRSGGANLIDEVPRHGIFGRVAFLHPESFFRVLTELVEREGEALTIATCDSSWGSGGGTRTTGEIPASEWAKLQTALGGGGGVDRADRRRPDLVGAGRRIVSPTATSARSGWAIS